MTETTNRSETTEAGIGAATPPPEQAPEAAPAGRQPRGTTRGRGLDRALIALLLLLALLPLVLPSYLVGDLTRAMIYGIAACSLGFIIRHGGMVSFGHAAYFGLGAYVVLIAQLNGYNEALIVWPMAVAVTALAALAIGWLSLQTRAVAFIMITLGFAQMLFWVFSGLQEFGATDGLGLFRRNTLAGMPISRTVTFHFVVLVILVLALGLFRLLSQSAFGLALEGIRQDEKRMVALGYNTGRLQLAAFVVSGAVTGLAGALTANYYLYVSPSYLHWLISGELLVMAALGGLTTLAGGLFGAMALILAEVVLSGWTTYWRIILGPVVILSVLFLRRGIHPALGRLLGQRDV